MNATFHLRIQLDNACFDDNPAEEVGLILRDLASRLMMDGFTHAGVETEWGACCGIWERNGNHCGHWRVVLGEDPMRFEAMAPEQIEALRTAINLRLCQMHAGGRECDCSEERESKVLARLDRELKNEIERRNA
jgi:hypothetical protein